MKKREKIKVFDARDHSRGSEPNEDSTKSGEGAKTKKQEQTGDSKKKGGGENPPRLEKIKGQKKIGIRGEHKKEEARKGKTSKGGVGGTTGLVDEGQKINSSHNRGAEARRRPPRIKQGTRLEKPEQKKRRSGVEPKKNPG